MVRYNNYEFIFYFIKLYLNKDINTIIDNFNLLIDFTE